MNKTISVEEVWKSYFLGEIGHGTIREDFQSWFARWRGGEDPNRIIGKGSEERVQGHVFHALKGVSLDVNQGEILGIIGKNGAGKSTLLKLLSRITAPNRGTIRVRGRVASLLEVGTGFHPDLTGRENIFLNGAILGMNQREVRSKLEQIVEFAGVGEHLETPVKRYSSGMRVRLGFAVAAHLNPDILIVDEVLAVGDAEFQKKCIGKMDEASKEQGRTILFVSHNMASIELLCQRVLWISEGSIVGDGRAHEIIANYLSDGLSNKILSGDGTLQIESVELQDSSGKPSEFFRKYQMFRVVFNIRVMKLIQNPLFKVGIYEKGTPLITGDMMIDGSLVSFEPGSHRLVCEFPELPLLPRGYSVTVSVRSGDGRDFLVPPTQVGYFQVVEESENEERIPGRTWGLVIKHDWKLERVS